jgi:hypothetical protein
VDPANGFPEEGRHGFYVQFRALGNLFVGRNGVRDVQFLNRRIRDSFNRLAGQNRMGAARVDATGRLFEQPRL